MNILIFLFLLLVLTNSITATENATLKQFENELLSFNSQSEENITKLRRLYELSQKLNSTTDTVKQREQSKIKSRKKKK